MIAAGAIYFLASFLGLFPPAHDFHLSKTAVHYNEEAKSLEVTMHIFIDDLELAMASQGIEAMYIATEKEHEHADSMIHKYISSVFQLRVDQQVVDFEFLGKEESEDLIAIWCYLEKKDITPMQTIAVRNSLLTEIYDDQKNMFSFKGIGIKEYLLFDDKKQSEVFRLP